MSDFEIDISAPMPKRKEPLRVPRTKASREYFGEKEKKLDTQTDKLFIEHLTKQVQRFEPEVGSFYFPHIKTLVFYWRKIIIHKLMLNELNIEQIPMKKHISDIQRTIRMIDMGLIPLQDLQRGVQGFNTKKTAKRFGY